MNYVFICPKPDAPSGGCLFIHKLAELAVKHGIPAYVLQTEPFEVWWSAKPVNKDLIKYKPFNASAEDILVIPEVLFPRYEKLKAKKVLFLQNTLWLETIPEHTPVITCSRHLSNRAKRLWNVDIKGEVKPYLEDGVWGSVSKELNSVLLYARRNDYHKQMKEQLEANGYSVVHITKPMNQRELAVLMSLCDYYVHLTHPEGFPAACLEAMRSKAVVVGTTGKGGNELMFGSISSPETSLVVQANGEIVPNIIKGINSLRDNPDIRERVREQAYQWSLRYTELETSIELLRVLKHVN
jgi:glycosyltransferase involved in cell wall biosynthesis